MASCRHPASLSRRRPPVKGPSQGVKSRSFQQQRIGAIYASDSSSGLCDGLPLINPTRLILRQLNPNSRHNKVVGNPMDIIAQLFPFHWTPLSIVDLPYTHTATARTTQTLRALSRSRTLHTVIIGNAEDSSWIHSALRECPLEVIQIKGTVSNRELMIHLQFDDNPALKALVKYTVKRDIVEDVIPAPGNPSFVPMKMASQAVQDRVWKRILYFAMLMSQLKMNNDGKCIPRRSPLLLVSKTFQIRTLWGSMTFDDAGDRETRDFYDDPSLRALLSNTTGLVRFCSWLFCRRGGFHMEADISWDAFEVTARFAGATLRVEIRSRRDAQLAVFGQLVELRSLDWKSYASFNCDPENVPSDDLPNLTELRIWDLDPSFLTGWGLVLSRSVTQSHDHRSLDIPLINVPVLETFFKAHGNKLTDLDFPYPILTQLNVNLFAKITRCSVAKVIDITYWGHEISKSYGVKWAEILLRHNINLTDEQEKMATKAEGKE
ncbi:hypothetical protein C8R44DRAFT_727425 [Mycena epipterygia]|nr:hypothetical protein C8R44DRAFT_727425 [Mycena epipterygia]